MNTKDLYMKYGVMLRKRHTSNQKIRFLSELEAEFKLMHFDTSIRKTKLKGKESFSLYVGNLLTANKIIATTYDTPLQTYIKMPYSPFNDENKKKRTFIGLTIPTIVIFFLGSFIVYYFATNIWNVNLWGFKSFFGYLITLLMIVLFGFFMKGVPSMNNYHTNTSSIVEIIKYAKTNKHSAYVFTDYGTQDNFGYLCLRDYLIPNKNYKIFFVDSIGNDPSKTFVTEADTIKDNRLSTLFEGSDCVSSGKLVNRRIVQSEPNDTYDNEVSLLKELLI